MGYFKSVKDEGEIYNLCGKFTEHIALLHQIIYTYKTIVSITRNVTVLCNKLTLHVLVESEKHYSWKAQRLCTL